MIFFINVFIRGGQKGKWKTVQVANEYCIYKQIYNVWDKV